MWVSTLSLRVFLPSLLHHRFLVHRSATSPRPSSTDSRPLRSTLGSSLQSLARASLLTLAFLAAYADSPSLRESTKGVAVPSFSPVPPDRLKLQSVASPSVGTLIRGRLHCSGTLLAALGYQLFPYCLWPSVFLTCPLLFHLPSSRRLSTTCYLSYSVFSFCHPSFFLPFFHSLPSRSRSSFLVTSHSPFFVLLSGRISVFMGVRSASW